ncbi:MAG: hypothetical protein ACI4XL_07135 [Bacillus sp. (in: firmicutes)]
MNEPKKEDQEAIKILASLPKVKDVRSPQDIYEKVTRKRKTKKWPKAAILVAAIMTLVILAPVFLNERVEDKEWTMESSSDRSGAVENRLDDMKSSGEETEKLSRKEKVNRELAGPLLFNKDLEGFGYYTVAFATNNKQHLIPLTFKSSVSEHNAILSAQVNQSQTHDGEQFGLVNWPMVAGMQSQEDNRVIDVDLSKGYTYEGVEEELLQVLTESFRYQKVEEFRLWADGKPINEFGGLSPADEHFIVDHHPKRAFLLYRSKEGNRTLYMPSSRSFGSMEAALDAMKAVGQNQPAVFPSIPAGLEIKVSPSTEGADLRLTITMQENMEEQEKIMAVEASLLTARDFGYATVAFEAEAITEIGPYQIGEPIEVPIAPNVVNVED